MWIHCQLKYIYGIGVQAHSIKIISPTSLQVSGWISSSFPSMVQVVCPLQFVSISVWVVPLQMPGLDHLLLHLTLLIVIVVSFRHDIRAVDSTGTTTLFSKNKKKKLLKNFNPQNISMRGVGNNVNTAFYKS